MATKNTGLNMCPDCGEYIEDCDCEDFDYEGAFADAWLDDKRDASPSEE